MPIFLVLGVVFASGSYPSLLRVFQRVKIRLTKTPTMIGKYICGCRATRWLVATVVVVSFCSVITAVNAAGYLSRFGPAPLLFQAPPSSIVAVLPPLLMYDKPDPIEPKKVASTNSPASNSIPTRLAGLMAATNALPVNPALLEPVTFLERPPTQIPVVPTNDIGSVPQAPAITPQMLIRFFDVNRGTNHVNSLLVPFIFTPPLPPGRPPSSTATYIKE